MEKFRISDYESPPESSVSVIGRVLSGKRGYFFPIKDGRMSPMQPKTLYVIGDLLGRIHKVEINGHSGRYPGENDIVEINLLDGTLDVLQRVQPDYPLVLPVEHEDICRAGKTAYFTPQKSLNITTDK